MVTLAVLVIPRLLDGPALEVGVDAGAGPGTEPTIDAKQPAPAIDIFRVGAESPPVAEDPDAQPEPAASEENSEENPESTGQALLPGDAGERDATPGGEAKIPLVPATAASGWDVRVGTFSEHANVQSTVALLTKNGFSVRQTGVQTEQGEATRIWLGPYAAKATAEQVARHLKILTGEAGFVTEHTP